MGGVYPMGHVPPSVAEMTRLDSMEAQRPHHHGTLGSTSVDGTISRRGRRVGGAKSELHGSSLGGGGDGGEGTVTVMTGGSSGSDSDGDDDRQHGPISRSSLLRFQARRNMWLHQGGVWPLSADPDDPPRAVQPYHTVSVFDPPPASVVIKYTPPDPPLVYTRSVGRFARSGGRGRAGMLDGQRHGVLGDSPGGVAVGGDDAPGDVPFVARIFSGESAVSLPASIIDDATAAGLAAALHDSTPTQSGSSDGGVGSTGSAAGGTAPLADSMVLVATPESTLTSVSPRPTMTSPPPSGTPHDSAFAVRSHSSNTSPAGGGGSGGAAASAGAAAPGTDTAGAASAASAASSASPPASSSKPPPSRIYAVHYIQDQAFTLGHCDTAGRVAQATSRDILAWKDAPPVLGAAAGGDGAAAGGDADVAAVAPGEAFLSLGVAHARALLQYTVTYGGQGRVYVDFWMEPWCGFTSLPAMEVQRLTGTPLAGGQPSTGGRSHGSAVPSPYGGAASPALVFPFGDGRVPTALPACYLPRVLPTSSPASSASGHMQPVVSASTAVGIAATSTTTTTAAAPGASSSMASRRYPSVPRSRASNAAVLDVLQDFSWKMATPHPVPAMTVTGDAGASNGTTPTVATTISDPAVPGTPYRKLAVATLPGHDAEGSLEVTRALQDSVLSHKQVYHCLRRAMYSADVQVAAASYTFHCIQSVKTMLGRLVSIQVPPPDPDSGRAEPFQICFLGVDGETCKSLAATAAVDVAACRQPLPDVDTSRFQPLSHRSRSHNTGGEAEVAAPSAPGVIAPPKAPWLEDVADSIARLVVEPTQPVATAAHRAMRRLGQVPFDASQLAWSAHTTRVLLRRVRQVWSMQPPTNAHAGTAAGGRRGLDEGAPGGDSGAVGVDESKGTDVVAAANPHAAEHDTGADLLRPVPSVLLPTRTESLGSVVEMDVDAIVDTAPGAHAQPPSPSPPNAADGGGDAESTPTPPFFDPNEYLHSLLSRSLRMLADCRLPWRLSSSVLATVAQDARFRASVLRSAACSLQPLPSSAPQDAGVAADTSSVAPMADAAPPTVTDHRPPTGRRNGGHAVGAGVSRPSTGVRSMYRSAVTSAALATSAALGHSLPSVVAESPPVVAAGGVAQLQQVGDAPDEGYCFAKAINAQYVLLLYVCPYHAREEDAAVVPPPAGGDASPLGPPRIVRATSDAYVFGCHAVGICPDAHSCDVYGRVCMHMCVWLCVCVCVWC